MSQEDVTDLEIRIARLQSICSLLQTVQSPEATSAISSLEAEITRLRGERRQLLEEESQAQAKLADRIDRIERTMYLFEPIIRADMARWTEVAPPRPKEEAAPPETAMREREQVPPAPIQQPDLSERLTNLENALASTRRKVADLEERLHALEQRPEKAPAPTWVIAAIVVLALAVIALGGLHLI